MDDEEETYRLWKIRKTIMQRSPRWASRPSRCTASACRRRTSHGLSSWCSRA
ncbi:POLR2E isoform 3 [Pan troglodytes]|uniref:RNA polymerase II, I and III subunit E n=4 Tax=Homininae TaxID=207598 RepID=K7EQN2_HUMAN|nr:RNA polymerase II, I and III subunit E [Homo sapiens]KAI4039228.1 RNA polymerase II, I and III subunit E [Homo sapiens]PNI16897.1 POLR2E isoform 3 [Pan troglodytes]